jgi:hypothetical protein
LWRQQGNALVKSSNGPASAPDHAPIAVLLAPLCVVHIPTTGGGTLQTVLVRIYSRNRVANTGNILSDVKKTEAKVARLQRFTDRAMVGHVPYSLYRSYMPEDAQYITILRDPVERAFSQYHRHVQGRPRGGRMVQSLVQALELDLPEVSNLCTRFLCDGPFDELSDNALNEAKRNLPRFILVGLQERFDESIVLMQRALGIEQLVPYGPPRHASEGRPPITAISSEERQLLLERNALDIELYAYARELFSEKVAAAGETFAGDVENLRALYSPIQAEHEEACRRAAAGLECARPPGMSRHIPEIKAAAAADGIGEQPLKEEMRAMYNRGRAVYLLVEPKTTFISAEERFLTRSKGAVLHVGSDEVEMPAPVATEQR